MEMVSAAEISEALGGERTLRRRLKTSQDLGASIRAGFPARSLTVLIDRLGFRAGEASAVLGMPARTLTRRLHSTARLTPGESDRLARVARVFATAVRALGDEEKARGWLREPNRALAAARPMDLLDTEPGARDVETVLGRLAYGVYS